MTRRRVVLLLAAGVLAGCGGGSGASPRIAAVRSVAGAPPTIDIVLVGADGQGETLTGRSRLPGVHLLRVDSPAWSPDGKEIYFTGMLAERQGKHSRYYESDIFEMHADGSGLRRLTTIGDAAGPVVSPDGKTVVFSRTERPGDFPFAIGLWTMNADGTGMRRLADSRNLRIDSAGAWSPDGRRFLFTRCLFRVPTSTGLIRTTCAIYEAARDSSAARRLADRAQGPAYSPDGKRVAFVSDRSGNGRLASGEDESRNASELYVMDADGSHQRQLTHTRELDEQSPSWSPDGSLIAYARVGPARFTSQLMLIESDGRCARRLIGNAASDRAPWFIQPRWRPGSTTRSARFRCR